MLLGLAMGGYEQMSEVTTKDNFFNIKNANRDVLLNAHRIPPQIMGIIPNNTYGFEDVKKDAQVFVRNDLTSLVERIYERGEQLDRRRGD
ncbi:hypothetical protein SN04_02235 [Serratia marcescens]|nr:hypothetical protein SN04_02235 [Serratia marcescens]